MMWKTYNCCFTKNIVTPGKGFSCPLLESKCYISVKEIKSVIFKHDALVDNFKDIIQQTSELVTGWASNGAVKLLEELVMTMHSGEISQFDVSTNLLLTHHDEQVSNQMENKCTIVLELTAFNDAIALWKLNKTEKYDLALCHKEEGSKLFKEGNVQAAFFHYSLATKYLISRSTKENKSDEDLDLDEWDKLKCICYVNLAACQLKYKNYQSVIGNCSKALNFDKKNVKAYFRRGTAFKELGRIRDARSDLYYAKILEPDNQTIKKLLQSMQSICV